MSIYGLKIKNYEAASVFETNSGVRSRYDSTDAMLSNSLFLDFLRTIGLRVYKDKATREVICLAFDYGTQSFDEALEKYHKRVKDIECDDSLSFEEKLKQIKCQEYLIEQAQANEDKFVKISKDNLRIKYYTEGVTINYGNESVHYKMLYRTPGKAKRGTCMFISDRLYKKARNFLYMGIKLPKTNAPIVEIGAYSSLITSSIVDTVNISPEEILIVKDISTFVTTNVIKVLTDENKQCHTEAVADYSLCSTMFDGQALIDYSVFPDWADGFVLLRNHFTKCAAFATNINLFMHEHFSDSYETATVKDMFGRDVAVRHIKLITTDNAIKWLKFGVSFDYWADWVRRGGNKWGVVKTAHVSKFGSVQRTSYQMINALEMDTMDEVVEYSVEYIKKLKTDDVSFLDFLRNNSNYANDYDALVALVEQNPDFVRCDYFRERKSSIIQNYILEFKSGRSLQNADNLTIVGSPYAMLLHAIGEDYRTDPAFSCDSEAIECWCERFSDGEYLAAFRSPFNSRNNLGYLHNVYHPVFDRYFKLGKLCIAVNTNSTDFQARNNGSDQDSDTIYTTNHPAIVNHAEYCVEHYPTIVNDIKPEKNTYDLSLESYARIDNKLMAAQLAIGESSNLAQIALTYSYNFSDQKYLDYVCILSVLAQVAIDNAKRTFNVDLNDEIHRIKKDLDIDRNGLPLFWQITKKDKRRATDPEAKAKRNKLYKTKICEKTNGELTCPMNYLYKLKFPKYPSRDATLPIGDFFISHPIGNERRRARKIEDFIEKYIVELWTLRVTRADIEDREASKVSFEELIEDIKKAKISKNSVGIMSWLINRAFRIGSGVRGNLNVMDSMTRANRVVLIKTLYEVSPESFLACFSSKKCTPMSKASPEGLEPDEIKDLVNHLM